VRSDCNADCLLEIGSRELKWLAGKTDRSGDPWQPEQLRRSLAAGDSGFCLQVADGIVGYALLKPLPGVMELLNLFVFPGFRTKGYGRKLLQYIEKESHLQGCTAIWLEVREGNLPALGLYRSAGFCEVGRRPGYYPGRGTGAPVDALLMEKVLAPASATHDDALSGIQGGATG
jgi:ribosomal-protein-alanine N-acetyltransferase